jgi:hypothetical protein
LTCGIRRPCRRTPYAQIEAPLALHHSAIFSGITLSVASIISVAGQMRVPIWPAASLPHLKQASNLGVKTSVVVAQWVDLGFRRTDVPILIP